MKLLERLVVIAAAFGIVGALAPALAYGEVPTREDLPFLVLAFGVPTAVIATLGAVAWQALPAPRRLSTRGQGVAIGVAVALVSQVTAAVALSLYVSIRSPDSEATAMRGTVRLLIASTRVFYITVPVGAILGVLLFGSWRKTAAVNSENDAEGDVGAI